MTRECTSGDSAVVTSASAPVPDTAVENFRRRLRVRGHARTFFSCEIVLEVKHDYNLVSGTTYSRALYN